MKQPSINAPEHLQAPEVHLWHMLVSDYGISDSGGLAILEAALEARGRSRRCREVIDREGELTPEGKPHPLMLAERDSRKLFLSALRQLDLDVVPAGEVGRPVTTTLKRVR